MLKKNNSVYLYASGGLLLLFAPLVEAKLMPLYLLTIVNFIVFFLVINSSIRLKSHKLNLATVVFAYSFLFMGLYNCFSFLYEGNFFLFSEMDASMYHEMSKRMAWMPFDESVYYYLESWGVGDLGAVVIISTLYRIIESNLFYNFVNIFIGIVSALGMFRIGSHIMSRRYAFVSALTFALSSYLIWFHASGLKESFMVMIVILFFDQFYMYVKSNKIMHVFYGAIIVLLLIFFRPILMFFCLASIGLGIFLKSRTGLKTFAALTIALLIFTIFFTFLESTVTHFLRGGDIAMMLAAKEAGGMVKGSIPFTYAVNLLSQLVGPLPSFLPAFDPKLSFYSVGLLYRVLLGFPFWIGVYYIFRDKKRELYPLIFFVFMEMGALALILEGLELRKSLPHFPAIYLISFWFMSHYNMKLRKKNWLKFLFYAYGVVITCMVLYWNFR